MGTTHRGEPVGNNHANHRLEWEKIPPAIGTFGETPSQPSTWHPAKNASENYQADIYPDDGSFEVSVRKVKPYWGCEDGSCEDETSLIGSNTELTYRTEGRAKNAAQALVNRHVSAIEKTGRWPEPYTRSRRQVN